ncbi:hypothetical protein SCHPADRAFT_946420 [Schizopora paradoxa]|uniref:JmjC domain-containing protein n=1 Tax=Schizopora paradoxa TaxID=27342 RepID=A0A0H2R985_9AGAM|nr:hypothetical protein SCHPADRAFT_946420 [Schizopora paradoxa]
MPRIDKIADLANTSLVASEGDVLHLHVMEDEETRTRVPFLSRSVSWTFCVEWLSNDNPQTWMDKMRAVAREEEDPRLAQIVDNICLPLFKVLVARNKKMGTNEETASMNGSDFCLGSSLANVLCVLRTLGELKTVFQKQEHKASSWIMTHLLMLLQDQDRLIWAISHNKCGPVFPLRVPEDDTALYNIGWLETIKKFIKTWEAKKESVSIKHQEGESVLRSLFVSTTQNQAKGALMPILNNIQEAALALASLRLYEGEAGVTSWHRLLQQNTGVDLKKIFKNHQFLRALFAAVVAGLLALFGGKSLGVNNSNGLLLMELMQMSFVPSGDFSYKRMLRSLDVFRLLIDVFLKGEGVLLEHLDKMAAWKSVLRLDNEGELDEGALELMLPPQGRDALAAFELAEPSNVSQLDELQLLVKNVTVNHTFHPDERTTQVCSRDEVNYVLNQRYDTESPEHYVDHVKTVFSKRYAEVLAVMVVPPPPPKQGQHLALMMRQRTQSSTAPIILAPQVTSRPLPHTISCMYRPEVHSGKTIAVVQPTCSSVLDLPKWNPNDSACVLEDSELTFDVFIPYTEGPNIQYPDTKAPLSFPWVTTKIRDYAPLVYMLGSAQGNHLLDEFWVKEDSAVSTLTQVKWQTLSLMQRVTQLEKKTIHLVHDRSVSHPAPILASIRSWSEADLSAYFNIFASDFATNGPHCWLQNNWKWCGLVSLPPPELDDVDKWVDTSTGNAQSAISVNEDVSLRVLEEEYSDEQDRQASIEQFLFSLHRTEQMATAGSSCIASILFIQHVHLPPTSLPLEGLDSFSQLQTTFGSSHPFSSRILQDVTPYAQLLSPTAMTRIHINPNGLANFMRLVLGYAVVLIGKPEQSSPDAMCTSTSRDEEATEGETWPDGPPVIRGYLFESMGWEMVVLCPGDDLIVQPGVPHCIVALEASLLMNGLFYSAACLDKTRMSLLVGHWHGHITSGRRQTLSRHVLSRHPSGVNGLSASRHAPAKGVYVPQP